MNLSPFVAILDAFALTKWNDDRKENLAESKILLEIVNGLEKDKIDINENMGGHIKGISACQFWKEIFNGESPSIDSLQDNYYLLTRDFISIQNRSGYETLKSRGFELIDNDQLRAKIISLYEYDYQILKKLEEEYNELQFQKNYFKELNMEIAPYLQFNENGNIIGLELPIKLSASKKNLMLSYL